MQNIFLTEAPDQCGTRVPLQSDKETVFNDKETCLMFHSFHPFLLFPTSPPFLFLLLTLLHLFLSHFLTLKTTSKLSPPTLCWCHVEIEWAGNICRVSWLLKLSECDYLINTCTCMHYTVCSVSCRCLRLSHKKLCCQNLLCGNFHIWMKSSRFSCRFFFLQFFEPNIFCFLFFIFSIFISWLSVSVCLTAWWLTEWFRFYTLYHRIANRCSDVYEIKLGHDKYDRPVCSVRLRYQFSINRFLYCDIRIASCLLSDVNFGFACLPEMGFKIYLHQESHKNPLNPFIKSRTCHCSCILTYLWQSMGVWVCVHKMLEGNPIVFSMGCDIHLYFWCEAVF